MKILILGAGGVGGYVGAKLIAAGGDVVFLVRSGRLALLDTKGLRVESALGNFSAPAKAIIAAGPELNPDLVVIACKAPALNGALKDVAPAIRSETRILTFLNGVAHLETVRSRFPETPLLGGIAHGALTLRQDGVIEHLSPFFSAIVGPTAGPPDRIVDELVQLLRSVGVDAKASGDIHQDMWNKFVFLATLAGATCLMRASIGTIVKFGTGRKIVIQLLAECLSIAKAEGFAPDTESMESYNRMLTEAGSTLTSSMSRDIQQGWHTEADHILGDMLRRARRHGIETPILSIANTHLQCYEATIAE